MNGTAVFLLALAAVTAAVDWWAVDTRHHRLEHVAKPAVMVWLIAAAFAIDAPAATSTRPLFVAALVLSLAGDVFLMVERDLFVAGLASFLLAHIAYVAGLVATGETSAAWLGAGVLVVGVGASTFGRRIVTSVRRSTPPLTAPVSAYVTAISVMVVAAFATAVPAAIAGAVLFYGSDAMLGWNRFVTTLARGPLAVIVTYHLGQVLLVASLAVF